MSEETILPSSISEYAIISADIPLENIAAADVSNNIIAKEIAPDFFTTICCDNPSSSGDCCEDPNIASVLTADSNSNPALNVVAEVTGSVTPSGLRIRMKITNLVVTDVANAIPLTALTARNSIIIENRSLTDSVFMGESGVTATGLNQGWEISPTSIFSTDVTNDIIIYVIAPAGKTANLKVMELA
jgi:hypothetical protein